MAGAFHFRTLHSSRPQPRSTASEASAARSRCRGRGRAARGRRRGLRGRCRASSGRSSSCGRRARSRRARRRPRRSGPPRRGEARRGASRAASSAKHSGEAFVLGERADEARDDGDVLPRRGCGARSRVAGHVVIIARRAESARRHVTAGRILRTRPAAAAAGPPMARSDDAAAAARLAPYFGLLTRRVQRARWPWRCRTSRGDRLLDLGCGLTDLPARFPSYVGCDRNPLVLSEMRRRHPAAAFAAWDVDPRGPPPGRCPGPVRRGPDARDPRAPPVSRSRSLPRRGAPRPGRAHPGHDAPPARAAASRGGGALGLLSRHADEEHETLLDRAALERAGRSAGLELTSTRASWRV